MSSIHAIDILIYALLFVAVYFQVFLFVTLVERRRMLAREHADVSRRRASHEWKTVTVIVPAYNEEKTIARTIESLLALDYPADKLTVAVVNDGSADRTSEIARSFADPRVVVYDKENGGKYTALNHAIERSESEFVGCLDADSFVTPGALKTIMLYFDRDDVMAVCPSVQIAGAENVLQKIQETEFLIGTLTKKIFSFLHAVYVTPGPFSIYRREVFEELGGFRHGYATEDMEMALRMQAKHMVIRTAHDAVVYTVAQRTLPALYKQRVRWVTGHLKNTLLDYRFMLFRRSYGHLGMFTLPFAFLSVLIALFFFVYGIQSFGSGIAEVLERWLVTGIRFGAPTFEWFFLESDMKRILFYYVVCGTVILVVLSSRLTRQKRLFSRGMIYFFFMYGLIAPLWLAKSMWNLVRAKEAPWR